MGGPVLAPNCALILAGSLGQDLFVVRCGEFFDHAAARNDRGPDDRSPLHPRRFPAASQAVGQLMAGRTGNNGGEWLMAQRTLEQRVAALEQQVAELKAAVE